MNELRYYPPHGRAPLVLGDNPPYQIAEGLEGLLAALSTPETQKATGQIGSTLTDNRVASRVVSVPIDVTGEDHADTWEARQSLSAALATIPARAGQNPEVGLLQVRRDGLPTVETPAVPGSGSGEGEAWRSPEWVTVNLEFFCPNPQWREVTPKKVTLAEEGGFEFQLEHPWESLAFDSSTEVDNEGSVPTPILAKVYGELTTVRLLNDTTEEILEVGISLAAGEHLEVNTAFSELTIVHVDANGVRTNAMEYLNLDRSDFWQLMPGINIIAFGTDTNVSGHAEVFYHHRYAGV